MDFLSRRRYLQVGVSLSLLLSAQAWADAVPTRLLLYRGANPRQGVSALLVQESLNKIHPIDCEDQVPLPRTAGEAKDFVVNHCKEGQIDPSLASVLSFKAFYHRKNRRFILSETTNGAFDPGAKPAMLVATVAVQTIDLPHPESVVMNYTVLEQPLAGNSLVRSGHFTGFKVGDFSIDYAPISDDVTVLP